LVDKLKEVLPFSESYIRELLPSKYKKERKPKEKLAVKMLTEKPAPTPAPQPIPKPEEKHLTCPICGSKLKLVGSVLVPA
jgi:hypothetical protein